MIPRTRMFRARCLHGTYWALMEEGAANVDVIRLACPAGCAIELTSLEPEIL